MHGCESKYLVYPYTNITNANKAIVKEYFELGISLQNILNEPYIDKQLVHRYDINKGTGEKEIDGQTYTVHLFRTLEEYKELIANAVLHNGWIVFMSHLRNTFAGDQYYYDSDVKTLIESVIEYAKIKGVEIYLSAEFKDNRLATLQITTPFPEYKSCSKDTKDISRGFSEVGYALMGIQFDKKQCSQQKGSGTPYLCTAEDFVCVYRLCPGETWALGCSVIR